VAAVRDAILRFDSTHGLTGRGLVAVSGGADSVALLRGLCEGCRDGLTVAHFNHRLRGAESDADEAFVRELAGRLGVAVRVGSIDVAAAGGNLEATARRLRYGWLAEAAAEVGAGWVATGHTADDQAETVLHRLIRGTGLQGLRGVAAERPVSDFVRLVRPLLGITRADVLAYLADLGQPYRTDATNADPAFTRTRIRHELLPLLKTFNPDVVSALCRLAGQAEDATAILAAEADRLLRRVELPRAGDRVILDATPFSPLHKPREDQAHPYLAREMFRRLWAREGWPGGAMTFAHWDRLHAVAAGSESAADFPGGVHARRAGAVVQLTRRA
jgi:tRNA(Ile)-lysidine synthase